MENRRLAIAIVLCCVIFIGWQILATEMGWIKPPEPKPVAQVAPDQKASPSASSSASSSASGDPFAASPVAPPAFTPGEGRLVTVDTPLYRAVFHSAGGILSEFRLKKYREDISVGSPEVNIVSALAAGKAPMGLLVDGEPTWTEGTWMLEGGDLNIKAEEKGSLRFVAEVRGMRVTREFTFSGDAYTIDEKVSVASPVEKTIKLAFTFDAATLPTEKVTPIFGQLRYLVFGGTPPAPENSQYNLTRVAWQEGSKFKEEFPSSTLTEGKLIKGNVSWMAVMNNYFMGAVSMAGSVL